MRFGGGWVRLLSIAVLLVFALSALTAPASFAFSASQSPSVILNHSNYSLTFDSHGDLWVSDGPADTILEYVAPVTSSSVPSFTLNLAFSPNGIAFDSSGNLLVADYAGSKVYGFTPPFSSSESPSSSFALNSANGLSFGPAGILYISSTLVDQLVGISNPMTSPAVTLLRSVSASPTDVAFDSSGNMWVSLYSANSIQEFAYPYTGAPVRTITGVSTPNSLAFDPSGNLWVVENAAGAVAEIAPPYTGVTLSLTNGVGSDVTGVAVDGSGNVWVADRGTAQVLEYISPAGTGTAVSCSPSTVSLGSGVSCKATVSGSSPTGTITFSTKGGGTFAPSSGCTLSSGSCSVAYMPSSVGTQTITASYSGDAYNQASSGSTILTVEVPVTGVDLTLSSLTAQAGTVSGAGNGYVAGMGHRVCIGQCPFTEFYFPVVLYDGTGNVVTGSETSQTVLSLLDVVSSTPGVVGACEYIPQLATPAAYCSVWVYAPFTGTATFFVQIPGGVESNNVTLTVTGAG